MARMYYSKRHYDRVSPRPDTASEIADRIKRRAAGEQACRERKVRFPVLTAENAQEAIEWQENRIAELLRR